MGPKRGGSARPAPSGPPNGTAPATPEAIVDLLLTVHRLRKQVSEFTAPPPALEREIMQATAALQHSLSSAEAITPACEALRRRLGRGAAEDAETWEIASLLLDVSPSPEVDARCAAAGWDDASLQVAAEAFPGGAALPFSAHVLARCVVSQPETCQKLLSAGAAKVLAQALTAESTTPGQNFSVLRQNILAALSNLMSPAATRGGFAKPSDAEAFVAAGGVDAACETLRRHADDAGVQECGFALLGNVRDTLDPADPAGARALARLTAAGAARLALAALRAHGGDTPVGCPGQVAAKRLSAAATACNFALNLARAQPGEAGKFAALEELEKGGAVEAAAGALWAHLRTGHGKVLSDCLLMLYAMTTDVTFVLQGEGADAAAPADEAESRARTVAVCGRLVATVAPETHFLESAALLCRDRTAPHDAVFTASFVCYGMADFARRALEILPAERAEAFKGALARRMREVGLASAVVAAQRRFPGDPRIGGCARSMLSDIESLGLAGAEAPLVRQPEPAVDPAEGAVARMGRQVCHHCRAASGPADPPMQVCGGCKAVRFCGEECMRAGWKAGHKAECKASSKSGSKKK